jgi:hypothetical protein
MNICTNTALFSVLHASVSGRQMLMCTAVNACFMLKLAY